MRIKGFVKTPEGYPVYKATVQIDGQNVVNTDEKGYYEYEVPAGVRTFKALKSARVNFYDKTAQEISEIKEINIDEYIEPIELVIDAKFKIELPDLTEPDKFVCPVELGFLDKLKNWLGELWDKIWAFVWEWLQKGIEWVKKAIDKLVQWIKDAFWNFWQAVKAFLLLDDFSIMNNIINALISALTTVGEALGDILAEINKALVDLTTAVLNAIIGKAQEIKDTVTAAFNAFKNAAVGFGNWFAAQVKTIYSAYMVVVKNVNDVFAWVLKKIAKGVWNLMQLAGVQDWYQTLLGQSCYFSASKWYCTDIWSAPWQYVYNAFWKGVSLVNQAKATLSKIIDVLLW